MPSQLLSMLEGLPVRYLAVLSSAQTRFSTQRTTTPKPGPAWGMTGMEHEHMNKVKAVIFDLDGVIVSTDELHFQAWSALAEQEGIPFTREDNERLRGVSRMESLEIILEKAERSYTHEEKNAMAERKNDLYRVLLNGLSSSDILPGVRETLDLLQREGIRVAIGSSSKNAVPILDAIGLKDAFEEIVDGTKITRSKPDPEVFLLAGELLSVAPEHCLVVEDAFSGVDAALAADMRVLAVGSAKSHPGATLAAHDLSVVDPMELLGGVPAA